MGAAVTPPAHAPSESDRARIARALGLSELQLAALASSEQALATDRAALQGTAGRVEQLLGLPAGTLTQRVAFAALAGTLHAQGTAHLLPPADFTTQRTSAQPGRRFRLDRARGERIARDLAAMCALTPIVIDYEHATLHAGPQGRLAPAAGWIVGAEWQDAVGLVARVHWTQRAAERIARGEFRHASPYVLSRNDEVTGVALAALVREPAIPDLRELQVA